MLMRETEVIKPGSVNAESGLQEDVTTSALLSSAGSAASHLPVATVAGSCTAPPVCHCFTLGQLISFLEVIVGTPTAVSFLHQIHRQGPWNYCDWFR